MKQPAYYSVQHVHSLLGCFNEEAKQCLKSKNYFPFPVSEGRESTFMMVYIYICMCIYSKNKPIHLCIININCCCMNSGRCMSTEHGNGDGF